MRPRLTLFDLDHTLLDGDSDPLWCEFLMERGLLDRERFAPQCAAMEAGYRAGTVGELEFCNFFVSTLAGRSAREWAPLRDEFLATVVAPRIGAAARALVAERLADSAHVVITTATNRFIAQATASHLGVTHLIATECEVDGDGRFTGRVAGQPNMRGGKPERLGAWLSARGESLAGYETTAYSDSINDLPLLLAVDRAVVVHADDRLAGEAKARGWPSLRLHGGG